MLERLKVSKERRGEGGFTLIELLIVIIILAILAAIVVFAVGTTTKNASVAACKSTVKTVETAIESYKAQTGEYPSALTVLETKTVTVTPTHPSGPWLHTLPPAAPTGAVKYGITYARTGVVGTSTAYTLTDHYGTGATLTPGVNADTTPDPCTSV